MTGELPKIHIGILTDFFRKNLKMNENPEPSQNDQKFDSKGFFGKKNR